MDDKNKNKQYAVYAIVSGFVFEAIAIVGICIIVGVYLDTWLNTVVLFKIIFILFGVFYSIYHLIRRVNKVGEKNGKD